MFMTFFLPVLSLLLREEDRTGGHSVSLHGWEEKEKFHYQDRRSPPGDKGRSHFPRQVVCLVEDHPSVGIPQPFFLLPTSSLLFYQHHLFGEGELQADTGGGGEEAGGGGRCRSPIILEAPTIYYTSSFRLPSPQFLHGAQFPNPTMGSALTWFNSSPPSHTATHHHPSHSPNNTSYILTSYIPSLNNTET